MRALVLVLMLLVPAALMAQDPPRKKKPQAKKTQLAHKKPTPEQIRKFKDLEKKQAR